MRNVLLTIEYDGSAFHGWQKQASGERSVQGELERVLSVLCAQPIEIAGTSRTDAGVHALGQRASFAADFAIPLENLAEAANNLLAGTAKSMQIADVRILSAEEVPEGFHARFSCKGKTYIYRIAKAPSALRRNYEYYVKRPPDVAAMREAAAHLVGTHDFAAFQAAGGTPRTTTVRTISAIEIAETDTHIDISVTGDGFLYNMVRIIVGTLVDVGSGKIAPGDIPRILESKDRQQAGHTAPPQGLYLKEIFF